MGVNDRAREKNAVGKRKSVGESYDAEFVGFVNPVISEEQKDAFESWSASASPWDALETHTADGVSVSVKWDARSSSFMGSATQRRVGSPNAGLVVTARAGSASKALLRVIFCLVVLSHAEKWTELAPVADPDRW